MAAVMATTADTSLPPKSGGGAIVVGRWAFTSGQGPNTPHTSRPLAGLLPLHPPLPTGSRWIRPAPATGPRRPVWARAASLRAADPVVPLWPFPSSAVAADTHRIAGSPHQMVACRARAPRGALQAVIASLVPR